MSIEAMLANAVGGLAVSQTALRTTSENVANVNTPNYVRRETIIGANTADGVNSTVTVQEIRRVVDQYFFRESLAVTAEAAGAEQAARVQERLQAQFGAPGDNAAFPAQIDNVFASFSELTIEAASTARRINSLGALREMASNFKSALDEIADQRQDVDNEIVTAVVEVNALIKQIYDLNAQIERSVLSGESANGLKDQQDQIIAKLAEFMDIRVVNKDAGRVDVLTGDGVSLVNIGYAVLSYEGEGAVSDSTVFSPITMQVIHPQTGDPLSVTAPIESNLQSGAIRAMLDLRDKDLPDYAAQLSAVAAGVVDQLNAAHNDNAAVPAPNTLTGVNTGLLATDAHGFTGRTSVAITDAGGALQRRVDIDFDAGTYSVNGGGAVAFGGGTIGDVITAISTGLGAFGTASLTGGVLTIDAAGAADGVALLQDETAPSSRAGRGFSHFFGLNDVLQTSYPSHFSTGLSGSDAHGFTPGDTIEFVILNDAGAQATRTVTVPAGATFNDLITAFNNPSTGVGAYFNFTLNADGELTSTPTSLSAGYRLLVANDGTSRGAAGVSFTDLFGVGPGPEAGRGREMQIRQDIEAFPSLLSLAKLDLSSGLVGDVVLTVGDNRGALGLEAAQTQSVAFDAVGKMAAAVGTVSEYAAQVLTNFANEARAAEDAKLGAEALLDEVTLRREDVQGVNIDEELAQMLVFQQSYNAAARLIQAAGELYDALLNAV